MRTLIARHALRGLARDRGVALLAVILAVMVAVSAFLGWSATQTVNAIYAQAVGWLTAQGAPVPPNPLHEMPPLASLRNLPVYVSFLGAFAAIVIGQALVETDRRAGVLPLIGTRAVTAATVAKGRMLALTVATGALMSVAGLVSILALLTLPIQMGLADWFSLAAALALGWLYMTIFGLLSLGLAARLPGTAAGLLAATVAWLAITFVLPALTGNVNPTAAINPVSALASVPDMPVFHWLSRLLGPVSLSEAFGWLEARAMGYLPAGLAPRAPLPLLSLGLAFAASAAFALHANATLDQTGGPDA
jgi:ABC-type transport system involved in multi-copper enzyme maturation permease subunit